MEFAKRVAMIQTVLSRKFSQFAITCFRILVHNGFGRNELFPGLPHARLYHPRGVGSDGVASKYMPVRRISSLERSLPYIFGYEAQPASRKQTTRRLTVIIRVAFRNYHEAVSHAPMLRSGLIRPATSGPTYS